eukprot:gene11892-biopygen16145
MRYVEYIADRNTIDVLLENDTSVAEFASPYRCGQG